MYRFFSLVFSICVLTACGENVHNVSDRIKTVKPETISIADYAALKGFPERAEERREKAFKTYLERTAITDYLLSSELQNDALLKLRVSEAINNVVIDHYFENHLNAVASEAKIKEFYEKNQAKFVRKEFDLAHILLKTKSDVEAARVVMRADEIKKEISAGLSFDEAVIKYSEDTLSASKGGRIETLASDNADPAIMAAIDMLKEDGISAPVITSRGVHLFKVLKVAEDVVAFDAVKKSVAYQLRETEKQSEMEKLRRLAGVAEQ